MRKWANISTVLYVDGLPWDGLAWDRWDFFASSLCTNSVSILRMDTDTGDPGGHWFVSKKNLNRRVQR